MWIWFRGSVIDIAISPQQATISALLSHVRKADIVGVSSLRRGVAEAIEAVAHGDESTSRVVGRVIDEIKLPPRERLLERWYVETT